MAKNKTNSDNADAPENPSGTPRSKQHIVLMQNAIEARDIRELKKLVETAQDSELNISLQRASKVGFYEGVKLLAIKTDPSKFNSFPIKEAAENGHLDCVKVLIPFSDMSNQGEEIISCAARRGHIACVAEIAKHVDTAGILSKLRKQGAETLAKTIELAMQEQKLRASFLETNDNKPRTGANGL